MRKLLSLFGAVCICLCLCLTACRGRGPEGSDPSGGGSEPQTVTVRIQGDSGCFSHTTFTVDKGTVLDGSYYENVVRISNGGKNVYFVGKWKTSEGEDFDFSQPVSESVTISPEVTKLYSSIEVKYPDYIVTANQELKDNADLKTVVFPYDGPNGDMSVIQGSGTGDAIFEGFNHIETAVIPQQVTRIDGAVLLNCTGLKNVYIENYVYHLNIPYSVNFLEGCTSLEHIYFEDEERKEKFSDMLDDAIAEAEEDSIDASNLERLKPLLAVGTAPDMTWQADAVLFED